MAIIVSGQIDKGRFQHCFTGGSAILASSVLATSWCKEYWQFVLAQGLGTGMGMGLIFGAGAQVLVTHFSKNLGIATGIASAGGAVGGMIFPAICEKLIGKVGFGWTVRGKRLIAIPLTHCPKVSPDPFADSRNQVLALVVLLSLIPANLIARERPGVRRKGKAQMDWTAFTDVPYLLVTAGLFFAFWGIYFGFYYIVSYAQQTLQLSPADATNLLILMNAANLPGRFLPPLLSDACLGPLNTLIPCTFLTAALLFLWLGADGSTAIHLLVCFYGFAAAGIQSLYNATVWGFVAPSASSKRKHQDELDSESESGSGFDERKARLRLAMVFVMIGVACLTGAPLGGVILDRGKEGRWTGAQVFAGTSVFMG
ncbi:MAG: hypothetical protein Q9179_004028, partial [Wetmoreana sp. 5 TL-2023]